jgi:hypothetical protein
MQIRAGEQRASGNIFVRLAQRPARGSKLTNREFLVKAMFFPAAITVDQSRPGYFLRAYRAVYRGCRYEERPRSAISARNAGAYLSSICDV